MSAPHTRRHSPGFYPSDRAALRDLRRLVDGQVAMVVHLLAVEANDDGLLRVGHLRELAEDLHVQPKWLKARLEAAEDAGLIEWQRAANQHADGHVRMLVDLRAPTRAATSAAPVLRPMPRPDGAEHSGETHPNSGEWRVESEEHVTTRNRNGDCTGWQVSWIDLIAYGYEYYREPSDPDLSGSTLTGFARLLKKHEAEHGPQAAAEWLTEALDEMDLCSPRKQRINAFKHAIVGEDHLDAAHPLMVAMKTKLPDLWSAVRWHDDGIQEWLVWPGHEDYPSQAPVPADRAPTTEPAEPREPDVIAPGAPEPTTATVEAREADEGAGGAPESPSEPERSPEAVRARTRVLARLSVRELVARAEATDDYECRRVADLWRTGKHTDEQRMRNVLASHLARVEAEPRAAEVVVTDTGTGVVVTSTSGTDAKALARERTRLEFALRDATGAAAARISAELRDVHELEARQRGVG